MSIYDDFPSRNKVLLSKDLDYIQSIVYKIDKAIEYRGDLQKYAATSYGDFVNMLTPITSLTKISDFCDKGRITEIQNNFRDSIIKELDIFVSTEIEKLKKEYGVLYQTKDLRYEYK